jgi:hypothetical protein
MVTLQNGQLDSVPLSRVAGQNRRIAPHDPLLQMARHIGISFGEPDGA